MDKVKSLKRIFELDYLRGFCILIMITHHTFFDLINFYSFPSSILDNGFVDTLAPFVASLFIVLCAISSSLSKSNLKRGTKLLMIALALSLVTHVFDLLLSLCVSFGILTIPASEIGIKFGILHFLSLCMLASPLLLKLKPPILFFLGILVFCLKFFTDYINSHFPPSYDFFFPFGIYGNHFNSGDYYPIIPWFGVFLFGIALGKIFYSSKISLIKRPLKDTFINKIGQHTMIIYLVHQPLILLVMFLIFKFL